MDELQQLHDQLGPNAQQVLVQFAKRLVEGVKYGDFEEAKDWTQESLEEVLDMSAYLAQLIQSKKRRE